MSTGTIRIGLRFDRRDRFKLRELAHRVRQADIQGDTATFDQAAEAAEQGVPLEVICTHPDEARQMAALYTRLGCRRPTIEELFTP